MTDGICQEVLGTRQSLRLRKLDPFKGSEIKLTPLKCRSRWLAGRATRPDAHNPSKDVHKLAPRPHDQHGAPVAPDSSPSPVLPASSGHSPIRQAVRCRRGEDPCVSYCLASPIQPPVRPHHRSADRVRCWDYVLAQGRPEHRCARDEEESA